MAQVNEYLSARKIDHSESAKNAIEGKLIRAAIRDGSKWDLVRTDCFIVFRFDDQDRLVSYEVREVYTGP